MRIVIAARLARGLIDQARASAIRTASVPGAIEKRDG
jgi:hypothetical protein